MDSGTARSTVAPIPQQEILDQLERILASKVFRGSARLQRFLRLAVDRTLSGDTDQLKEYAVGRDVFDRGANYDPRLDSIVRVEARRLRRKLREYYRDNPADPVVIHFPRGSYAAEFSHATQEPEPILTETIPATPDPRTVAVLPFSNLSNDPEQQYFCDGITEDIINALTPISELQVIGSTSMFSLDPGLLDPAMLDPREIGHRLGAGTIVEGSVRKAGDLIRVSAKIVDAETRQTKWSQVFDRQTQELFTIEDEIARSIAGVLRITLQSDRPRQIPRPAPSTEAHELYLRGRQAWNQMTRAGYLSAIDLFSSAITLYPDYAPPYAGFAYSHLWLSMWGGIRPSEAFPKCKEASLAALRIDPNLAAGYASMGACEFYFERHYSEGLTLLKKAVELQPGYAFAHELYGRLLMTVGRFDEAIECLTHAVHLDPLSFRVNRTLGTAYSLAGRLTEAEHWGKTAMALRPGVAESHYLMARVYLQQNDLPRALVEAREAENGVTNAVVSSIVGVVLARMGDVAGARAILDRLATRSSSGYVDPLASAYIESALGDQKAALEHVRQSREDRSPFATHVNIDPFFAALHADPEFTIE
jgi:adenylate cyclase